MSTEPTVEYPASPAGVPFQVRRFITLIDTLYDHKVRSALLRALAKWEWPKWEHYTLYDHKVRSALLCALARTGPHREYPAGYTQRVPHASTHA